MQDINIRGIWVKGIQWLYSLQYYCESKTIKNGILQSEVMKQKLCLQV